MLPLIVVAVAVGIDRSWSDYSSAVRGTTQGACEGSTNSPNYVFIAATIIAVDTDTLSATVRVDFTPNGNLINEDQSQDFSTLARSMTVATQGLLADPSGSSSTGAPSGSPSYTSASSSFVFVKGDYMQDIDLTLPLEPGTLKSPSPPGTSTAKYPWDTYVNTSPFALQVRNGLGTGGAFLPSCVGLSSSVGGWTVVEHPFYVNNAFDVSFARSHPVKFYCYFVMALMWALALGGVAMAVIMMMRKQDEIDTAAFAYLAALLFAFPLIRQTLPGNPGPGSLIDILAYYWTEVIVAATLVVLLVRWITIKGKQERKDALFDDAHDTIDSRE